MVSLEKEKGGWGFAGGEQTRVQVMDDDDTSVGGDAVR